MARCWRWSEMWLPVLLLLPGCSGAKKQFQEWASSGEEQKGLEKKESIVRPPDAQGMVPKADQAVAAAQQLHRQLHPGERGERVISAIPGETGTVRIYLEQEGKREVAISYWVARKEDGLWRAYYEFPRDEDFDFVFRSIAEEYLRGRHPGKIKIHDLNIGTGEAERTVRLRFSEGGGVFTRKLFFKRDEQRRWMVVKEEEAASVFD